MDKQKIVVIDDEKDLCLLIQAILEGTGKYEVLMAHDGLEGIKLIAQTVPSLIFVDFVMPKATGDKVIAATKADPRHRESTHRADERTRRNDLFQS